MSREKFIPLVTGKVRSRKRKREKKNKGREKEREIIAENDER